jgi:hypothetical protein
VQPDERSHADPLVAAEEALRLFAADDVVLLAA